MFTLTFTVTKTWVVRTAETALVIASTAFIGSIVAGGTVRCR